MARSAAETREAIKKAVEAVKKAQRRPSAPKIRKAAKAVSFAVSGRAAPPPTAPVVTPEPVPVEIKPKPPPPTPPIITEEPKVIVPKPVRITIPREVREGRQQLPVFDVIDIETGKPIPSGKRFRPPRFVPRPPSPARPAIRETAEFVTRPAAIAERRAAEFEFERGITKAPEALRAGLEAGFERLRTVPGRKPSGVERFAERLVIGGVTAVPALPAFVFSVVTKPVETGQQFVSEFARDPLGTVAELVGGAVVFGGIAKGIGRLRAPRADVSVLDPTVITKAEISPFVELRQFDIITGKKVKIIADIETKFPETRLAQKLFGTLKEKKPGEFAVDLTGAERVVKGLRDPTRFEVAGKLRQLEGKPVFKKGKITGLADVTGDTALLRTRADLIKISRDLEQATLTGKRLPKKISKIESLVLEERGKPIAVGAFLERELLPRGKAKALFGEQVVEKVVTEIPGGVRVQEIVKGVVTEPKALKKVFRDLGISAEDFPKKAFRTEADLFKFFKKERIDIDPGIIIKEIKGTVRGRGKIPVTDLDKAISAARRPKVVRKVKPSLSEIEISSLQAGRAAARAARGRPRPITAPPELAPRVAGRAFEQFEIPITIPAVKMNLITDPIQAIKSETMLKRKQAQELIPGLKLGRIPAAKVGLELGLIGAQAVDTLAATATAQAQAQTQAQAQAQLLKQMTRLRQETRLGTFRGFRGARPGRGLLATVFVEEPLKKRLVTKRPREFYDVFLKPMKTKKFIRANREPLLISEAQDLGSFVSDTTLSAAYKIRKKKARKKPLTRGQETRRKRRKLRPPAGYGGFTMGKFREFKIRQGRRIPTPNDFIERRGFRLDTQGEVNKITAARRIAELRRANPIRRKKARRRKTKRRI